MRYLLVSAIFLWGMVSPVSAQDIRPTPDGVIQSYEDAARRALSWHPSIIAAAARLNQQEQQVDAARAGYKPEITAGVSSGYDSATSSRWRPRANVGLNQMLWDFGKVSSDVAAERAGTRASKAEILAAADAIIRDVAYAIIEIKRNQALLDAAQEQLGSVEGISNLVDTRYRKGASTKSDMLQAMSRVDAARATISGFTAEVRRWHSNLAYLLGRQSIAGLAQDMDYTPANSCQNRDVDWDRMPSLIRAEAERDRAMAIVRRERAGALPTFSLGAGANSELHRPLNDDRTDYNVGINVSSTVFSGGSVKARMRGSQYALSAADAALANVRNDAERLLAEAREQDSALEDRAAMISSRYGKMEETRGLYRLQYLETGTRTLLDLLNSEQEFSQTRFEAISARHDLMRLSINCLDVSGRLRQAFHLDDMVIEGVAL